MVIFWRLLDKWYCQWIEYDLNWTTDHLICIFQEESDDESGGEYIEAEENESLIPSPGEFINSN